MKKSIFCLLVLLVLIALTGCVNSFYFEYDDLARDVEKAEIINLDKNHTIDEDIEVVHTLTYDETLQLLSELSKIEYKNTPLGPGMPPTPLGLCIRVWYSDGRYEIYGSSGTTTAWGECEKDVFDSLIEKYMVS